MSHRWFFVFAALFFVLAGVSAMVSWLGPPMIFAFITLCAVFIGVGAVETKKAELREREKRSGTPQGR